MLILSYNDLIFDIAGEGIYKFDLAIRFPNPKEDLSGNSSFTKTASKGNKPAVISVNFCATYKRADIIRDIREFSLMMDENNETIMFDCVNDLLELTNVRKVVFDGDIDVKKIDGVQAFSINFTLREQNSIAEKTEIKRGQKIEVDNFFD